jgi:hemerythrin-like domain-containing protein
MKPTDILSQEHRVIEQVLDCLERMADRAATEHTVDESAARQAIDFFRNFADHCHHAKEESHLFPAMEARGFPRDCGPTGVMLREHELGRDYIRAAEEAVGPAASGDEQATRRFVQAARQYIGLLREHIQKEDHCLFSMANQAFSDEDQHRLLEAFQRVEAQQMGLGTHEKFLKIADDLATRYGVPREVTMAASHQGCGCSHHE